MSVLVNRAQESQLIDGRWVLGEEFISQYRGKQPKWGFEGLGWVVYVRTYSREKADGTMESWWETAERVTLGNYNTEINGEIDRTITKEEIERFYHLFFNLAFTPPGRSLWMSGTEYSETNGDAMNNCWYTDVVPQARYKGAPVRYSTPFVFVMDQAAKGGGVGAGVYLENIEQFPVTHNEVELTFVVDEDHGDRQELDDTELPYMTFADYQDLEEEMVAAGENFQYYRVDDSRQGWTDDALTPVIDSHYKEFSTKRLFIDLSDIRMRGSKIVRFGGTASGVAPLIKGLHQINGVLNKTAAEGRKITDVEAGDLVQIIGTIIVAGNVRRTAIILLGSKESQAFIESKDYSKMGLEPSQWRWASNNSIIIDTQTTREEILKTSESIFFNGEPGVVNLEMTQNYGRVIDGRQEGIDAESNGTNPCGEISLTDKEPCNLFEVNLVRCKELEEIEGVREDSILEEAVFLATRYTYRVTFRPYEWERSREVIEKNRRLGVGVTGYSDYTLLYHDGDYLATAPVLDMLYKLAKQTNMEHAAALGTTPSIKLTTVKPSGSVSKLMGCSAGQHDHWDEYIIQRIRISANAPIMDLIYKSGYPVLPEIKGRTEDGKPVYDYNTCVVEFPVKAPTAGHAKFRPSSQVPLMEQAERQAILQRYWSDNAVSATLTFHKPTEENGLTDDQVIGEIADVLDTYKNVFKSTSLLPHATGTYDLMPWESITKEEYENRVSKLNGRPWDFLQDGLVAVEEDVDNSMECAGGACPIR